MTATTATAGDGTGAAAPSPPPASSDSVGLIVPPPDVRVVVDHTAAFVRRHGSEAEAQIIAKNPGQRKFAFLQPESPYHQYYRCKVNGEDITSKITAIRAATPTTAAAPVQPTTGGSADNGATATSRAHVHASPPRPPPSLRARLDSLVSQSTAAAPDLASLTLFSASSSLPSFAASAHAALQRALSPHDLDVVKLACLFIAHLGPAFCHQLIERERGNSVFDFLRPSHPFHAHCEALIQSYITVLSKPASVLRAYGEQLSDRAALLSLQRAKARAKREAESEERERKRRDAEDTIAASAIDWQAFTVVDTITFTADEEASPQSLPQPKSTIEEMVAAVANIKIAHEKQQEEDEQHRRAHDEKARSAVVAVSEDALEIRAAPLPAPASSAPAVKLVTCVLCGDSIPVSELEEHMRIELLDPQWRAQKQRLSDRQRDTGLTDNKQISENLARMEQKRKFANQTKDEHEHEQKRQAERDAEILFRQRIAQPTSSSTAPNAPIQPHAQPGPTLAITHPAPSARQSVPASAPSPSPAPTASTSSPPPHPPRAPLTATAPRPVESAPERESLDDRATKRARIEGPPALISESEWLAAHPAPISVTVTAPGLAEPVCITVQPTDSSECLKAPVSAALNAPANRLQFQLVARGLFLKDGVSFAHYNLADSIELLVKSKERGGKKR